ncbi:hypothetical protein BDR06DRAFT_669943 [Suillus hirtellus]|nr:hypothetical protein BDR06DRAFT_669943 [Suillus hirtellus]
MALFTPRVPAPRRTSVSGLATTGQKAQRSSETTQKLVLLPSAPQTKPLLTTNSDDILGYETDTGVIREYKSAGERMSKEQRNAREGTRMSVPLISFRRAIVSQQNPPKITVTKRPESGEANGTSPTPVSEVGVGYMGYI